MAGEMFQDEIEEGGDWYQSRLELENAAYLLKAKNFKVLPFDQYNGPVCKVEGKNGKSGDLFLSDTEDEFELILDGEVYGFSLATGEINSIVKLLKTGPFCCGKSIP